MNVRRFKYWLKVVVEGHLLNPLWKSRLERRRIRGRVIREAAGKYLRPYAVMGTTGWRPVQPGQTSVRRVFSLWLQGEQQAPPLVRACLDSIRRSAGVELVVLDGKTLSDWIDLPPYVLDKWHSGRMKPAHFADICRIELLYQYGGVWMDATDYLAAPLPEWLWKADFFVYKGGNTLKGAYAGIQNCFIRAEKGSALLGLWRDAVLNYWAHEETAIDYFVHQLLLSAVLQSNPKAAPLYAEMPAIDQDPTHVLWFQYADAPYDAALMDRICSKALFQKTNYKSPSAEHPVPGSFADHILRSCR